MSTSAGPRAESSKSSRPHASSVTANCSMCASPCRRTDRHVGHDCSEHLAHARDPGPVDEPEVIRRTGPQPIDQLARRELDGVGFGPQLRQGRRRSAQNEADRQDLTYSETKTAPVHRCPVAAEIHQRSICFSISRRFRPPYTVLAQSALTRRPARRRAVKPRDLLSSGSLTGELRPADGPAHYATLPNPGPGSRPS